MKLLRKVPPTITTDICSAIKMVALYFGMMGASFALGGIGGGIIANREVLV